MKLVLASKNKKKLAEMNDILSHLGVEVCSEAEAGVDVEVEETGTTFEENSLLKARAVMEASGLLRAVRGRPQRRAGGVLRPVRRAWAGRPGTGAPAAGEHAGPDAPDLPLCIGDHLLLPQRGSALCQRRRGGHRGRHPQGGGRRRR